jgi:hypothetical protein
MRKRSSEVIGLILGTSCLAAPASATTVPFTEAFTADAANWRDRPGAATATWFETGGADGGGYISEDFNFVASTDLDPPIVLLRGQSNFNSSGNNFFGDWIGDGVTEFRVWVRHDAPADVVFFARFASPAAFPGAFAELGTVAEDSWTELTLAITADNPQFITFEGADFETVFSDIGRIQVGVFVPPEVAGQDAERNFDVDLVAIRGSLAGDTDGNGCVDLNDLTQLLAHFGTLSGMTVADGDCDADGDVDLSDLTLLLSNYGVGICG